MSELVRFLSGDNEVAQKTQQDPQNPTAKFVPLEPGQVLFGLEVIEDGSLLGTIYYDYKDKNGIITRVSMGNGGAGGSGSGGGIIRTLATTDGKHESDETTAKANVIIPLPKKIFANLLSAKTQFNFPKVHDPSNTAYVNEDAAPGQSYLYGNGLHMINPFNTLQDSWIRTIGKSGSAEATLELAMRDNASNEYIYDQIVARQYKADGTIITDKDGYKREVVILGKEGESQFPGPVTSQRGFVGDVDGNAKSATKAKNDWYDQVIDSTYLSKIVKTAHNGSKFEITSYDGRYTPVGSADAKKDVITIPGATTTLAGLVTTGDQTFTGNKTINSSGTLTIMKAGGFIYSGIQEDKATNKNLPLWFSTSTANGTPNYSTELTYNPSTGTVTAKKFAGPATSATYDAEGGAIHDKYLKRAGGTMTGALKFADNIYNAFGDDVEIGSQNAAGKLNIHGKNGATGIVFIPYSGSTSQTISIDGAGVMTITGTVKTTLDGNASTATTLKTARNFNITDSSAAYSGPNVSFNGSADVTLHMPDTFAGTLKGNADTATKLATARTLWGQSFNGTANVSGNMTGVGNVTSTKTNTYTLGTSSNLWKAVYATTFYGALSGNADTATKLQTARTFHITDSSATYNGANVSFDGTGDVTLHMPSTFAGTLKGNADTATSAKALTSYVSIDQNQTVAQAKAQLRNKFKEIGYKVGAIVVPGSYVAQWSDDSKSFYASHVNSFISLNPGYDNYNYGHFLVAQYGSSNLCHIGLNSGAWTVMRVLLDSSNYTSYTVKKDGTGATGTWGISITGNAATATQAQSALKDGDLNEITTTYLKKSGGTMTGALNFANGTYNKMGDDVEIGDKNTAGKLYIHGLNGATGIVFAPYSGSTSQTLSIDGAGVMTITGTLKATLSGNASTATTLQTARNFHITDSSATYNGPNASFNGSADITLHMPSTFAGTLKGHADSSTIARSLGTDNTMKLYAQYNNEINFGGTGTANTIFMGYRATDSRPIPAKFVFGGSTGTATLVAATFQGALSGNATSATKLQTARNFHITDSSATYNGPNASFNGTADITLHMPSTFAGSLKGNADSATKATKLSMARAQITTAADLDAFLEAGVVKYTTVSSNIGVHSDGMVLSLGWGSGSWGHQIFADDSALVMQHRHRLQQTNSDGTKTMVWSAWSTLLDSVNYANYTVKKDGTGATGTWGINITGSASSATTAGSAGSATKDHLGNIIADTYLKRYRLVNSIVASNTNGVLPPAIFAYMHGYPMNTDPEFSSGNNGISVYDNNASGKTTITRIDLASGNSSGKALEIRNTGTGPSPNLGGWYFGNMTANARQYTCVFRAKVPAGYKIGWHSNSIGTGGTSFWLTDNAGTGKWEWYAYHVACGNGGNSSTMFFALEGTAGTSSAPVIWYLSYANTIINSYGNYDGLRTRYADNATNATASTTATKWATARNFQTDLSLDNPTTVKVDGSKDVIIPITGILATKHGGTGNSSHTANRLVWSETATKLSATNNHYANASKIAVNYTSAPSTNFYVGGTSYLNGNTTINGQMKTTGPLLIGSDANGRTKNYIAFYGITGDGPDTWNHTFIGENLFGDADKSELILFKGNDPGSTPEDMRYASGPGPDRIRHIAAGHLFQIYRSALSGTFATIAQSTVPISIFEVNQQGVVVYNEGTDAQNYPAKITFKVKDTVKGTTSTAMIAAYSDHGTASYGSNLYITSNGNTVIQAGDGTYGSYANLIGTGVNQGENLYLTADGNIQLCATADTSNRKLVWDGTTFYPSISNTFHLGSKSYRWASAHVYRDFNIYGTESTGDESHVRFNASDNSQRAIIAFNGNTTNTLDATTHLKIATNYGDIRLDAASNYINVKGHILPRTDFTATNYNIGSTTRRWGNVYANALRLQGPASNPSEAQGARIEFAYDNGSNRSQPVYISYTPNDGYRVPYGLKIFGTEAANYGAWLEVQGAIGTSNTNASSGIGISLYGGPVNGKPIYGMFFGGTATFGKLYNTTSSTYGVSSDWATYFTMSDTTNRGWLFMRGATNVAGVTGNGTFLSVVSTGSHIAGNQGKVIIDGTAGAGYNMLFRQKSTNGVFTGGAYNAEWNLYYTANSVITAGTNSTTYSIRLMNEAGNTRLNRLGINGENTGYQLYVNGTSYYTNKLYFTADTCIIQNQASTSNSTTAIKWYKGGASQNTYNPSISQHNTGGDGTGSITILPYPTATSPWDGTVGLFIQKGSMKLDGKRVPTTGNNTGTVGSSTYPIYSNAGTLTQCSYYLQANIKSYSGSLATGGWNTLNGKGGSPTIAIAYNNRPAAWNSETYSATMVWGCNDTRGFIDCGYNASTVTFGGASHGNSTNNAPKWYMKLSGTNGTTYNLNQMPAATAATYVKDRTNGTATYLNYGASGIASSSWYCAWNGYEVRAISPANLATHLATTTLDTRYLKFNGWWSSGSGQNVNNANGMIFCYSNHGVPTGWGILTTFDYQYNSGYKTQFFTQGYDCIPYIRTRSADRGGWTSWKRMWCQGDAVTGAVWNDYAECRKADTQEPGYVMFEIGDDSLAKTTRRLQHFAGIVSDTWGFSQGETEEAKTNIAVAGRVLAYPYQDRNNYKPGDCVCAAPGGTVDIMSREEIIRYPDRIVGTVSCVPDYEEWGGGENADRDPVKVNGRIWIKVR